MCSPQVSTALFGSTAGENQGKTGQGRSVANFLLAPRKAEDPHAEAWLAWLQAGRDHKEAAHVAAQRNTNHAAHQGGGTHTPQVSTALSGSTVGKNQRKTGQGVSAADFLPAPRKSPYAAHQGSGMRGIVWSTRGGKTPGENRTGRKRCGFSPDHGNPVQKKAAMGQRSESQIVIGGVDQGQGPPQ
jgi:hypothetical protein